MIEKITMSLINVHEHLQSRHEVPRLLRVMDSCDIERSILLGSSAFTLTSDYRLGFRGWEDNNLEIVGAARAHPDRIEAWPTLDPADPDKLNKLRAYHNLGASGLKLYTGHGFVAPGASSYLFSAIAIDDPQMDGVYKYCDTQQLPVCLHVNPTPAMRGFADEFACLLGQYPTLRINAPHWMLSTGKPGRLAEFLDVFPNLMTDVSFGADPFLVAGLRRISENVLPIRNVIRQHPDRFMFGTDFVVTDAAHKTEAWMRIRVLAYLSMLSRDIYETPLLPGKSLNGLAMPPDVMTAIAGGNYCRWRSRSPIRRPSGRSLDWGRLGMRRPDRKSGQRITYMADHPR